MTSLLWETALLLLGAYFLGTFTGCLIRRTFFARAPAGQIAPQPAAAPIAPQPLHDPVPVAAAAAEAPIEEAAFPVPASSTDTGPQEVLDGEIAAAADVPSISEPPIGTPPIQEHAPEHVEASPAISAPPSERDEPAALRPEHSSRSIGTSAAAAAALAAAAARQQAAARERSAETEASAQTLPAASGTSGQASTVAPRAHMPVAAEPSHRPGPAPVAGSGAGLDDLTRIRAIDTPLQKRLNALGVRRFTDIAAWRTEDVRFISQALGFRGRIEKENWIEQAQILMSGSQTAFSRSGHPGPLAKPTADEGDHAPVAVSAVPQPAQTSGVEEAVAAAVSAAQPRRVAAAVGRDNLQRVSRVSEDIEHLLNAQGVMRYEQIAHWTTPDVARFDRLMGNDGRISRENWIEQAHILAAGGETAYSREFDRKHAASPRPRPTQLVEAIRDAQATTAGKEEVPSDENAQPRKVDLSSLRSVRSEALVGVKPEGAVGIGPGERLASRPDDLKRIRGIGVLFENRLNGMGFWTYEQIANWTAADVARVCKALEVKGQIERENWVEQARILASGQRTEFARRLDRGEVAVNRTFD